MINLVGNSCIASYITRDFIKQKFINPFCWSIMDFESCYNLVKFWDVIDFRNFKLIKDNNWNFSILIDNKVTVKYVHYLYDHNATTIKIKENDVYWNHIWEYIVSKYVTRTKHIKDVNPIFLFATANHGLARHATFTETEQLQLDELNSPYTIILSFAQQASLKHCISIPQTERFTYNGRPISNYIFEKISYLFN